MSSRVTRRTFVRRSSQAAAVLAGASCLGVPAVLAERSPNSKLNIAGIGVAGRGRAHVRPSAGENLVAVCDVVEKSIDGCMRGVEKYYKDEKLKKPLPQVFYDYRQMLDKIHKQIDAVFVATPDHHHAPAAMRAIKLGKHVYCEKPLTHTIDEARQLRLAAQQHKVATQLGNQGRASEGWRLLCEWIWAGVIGQVKELHVWTDRAGNPNRFWWPQGATCPKGSDPIPAGLHWEEWLGPAKMRPYVDTYKEGKFKGRQVYQPFVWRGWWDFGTGALGDIGCHALSGPFSALKIEYASAVELIADTGDTTKDQYPTASTIRWKVPARAGMAPCTVTWYDGGHHPTREIAELAPNKPFPDTGAILIGERGKISYYGFSPRLLPESKMKEFVNRPPKTIPRCASDHFGEWITACKGGRPAFSNFDHAGPLTEFVLLGNMAIRAGRGKEVLWDGANMKCTNRPELNQFVHGVYRKGWEV
jgi:predicted dehydrogenase